VAVNASVRIEHPHGAAAARVLRAAARTFIDQLALAGEVSIVLVTDRRIRALNRKWRGKDKATDVLSFPQDHGSGAIGDVVISLDTAKRQARDGGWPLSAELRRLLAHGLLHCLGHDHQQPVDARKMAKAEEKLLGRHGMVGEALTSSGG
jgi:probable rRNA maturation factor